MRACDRRLRQRQNPKAAIEQANGRQQRSRFAEHPVRGGPASPQQRVIHAGKIIQDQGGGMHHLQRAGRIQGGGALRAMLAGGQHREHRAHALAGSQQRVALGGGHALSTCRPAQGQKPLLDLRQYRAEQRMLLSRRSHRFAQSHCLRLRRHPASPLCAT